MVLRRRARDKTCRVPYVAMSAYFLLTPIAQTRPPVSSPYLNTSTTSTHVRIHNQPLNPLSRRPPQHIRQPLRPTNHQTVPRLNLLHNIKSTRLYFPSRLNNKTNNFRRKARLIVLPNNKSRRNISPRSIRLRTRVDPEALWLKSRSPLIAFGVWEVVVEDAFCVGRVDGYDALLERWI